MNGALLLAARSALWQGCGKVFTAWIDPSAPRIDVNTPEIMFRTIDDVFDAPLTALAIGPGLGLSQLAQTVLARSIVSPLPLVLDADALNLLAQHPVYMSHLKGRTAPTVLTPHPAEAARLLNCSVDDVQQNRVHACNELVQKSGSLVILKGQHSLVGQPSPGSIAQIWVNPTGNPGMATAGMGDVLSGMLSALLAQGIPTTQAALAATYIHGLAADELVSEGVGPIGLTASEVAKQARTIRNRLVYQSNPRA